MSPPPELSAGMNLAIALIALAVIGPLTFWGIRFARRHRRVAFATASLLLLFGINFTVDPPPPPRIEAVEDDEEAGVGEPK